MPMNRLSNYGFAEDDLLVAASNDMIQRDLKIFKVGTFTDSYGRTKTWTLDDLDEAVQNFYQLRDDGTLPNVPVREDHTRSVKDIVGYIVSLRRIGEFLYCDVEWAGWQYKANWDDGKYRNRSIEIGQYVTNAGVKYEPVVVGLAFVDLPAVEGLYRISEGEGMGIKSENDTKDDETVEETTETKAEETTETKVEEGAPETKVEETTETPETKVEETKELVSTHSAAGPAPYLFRVAGAQVHDYAAVQAHIDSLEQFQKDTIQADRTSFVEVLQSNRVITPAQAEQFLALVHSMDSTQFDVFRKGFEGAPAASIYGRHDVSGANASGGSDPAAESDARADRIAVLEQTVRQHMLRGVSEADIQKMGSWQELQSLKSQS